MSLGRHPEAVGRAEIAQALGVSPKTVDGWRQPGRGFPAPRWTVGGNPAWAWEEVRAWHAGRGGQEHLVRRVPQPEVEPPAPVVPQDQREVEPDPPVVEPDAQGIDPQAPVVDPLAGEVDAQGARGARSRRKGAKPAPEACTHPASKLTRHAWGTLCECGARVR